MKKQVKNRARLKFWAWVSQGINLIAASVLFALFDNSVTYAIIGIVLAVLSISTAHTKKKLAILNDDLSSFSIIIDYLFCFGTSIALAVLTYITTSWISLVVMIPVLFVEIIIACVLKRRN